MNFTILRNAFAITVAMLGHLGSLGLVCAEQNEPSDATEWTQQDEREDSFRVVTKIFTGKAKEAVAEHLILFHEGLVYDVPQLDGTEVTVYDMKRGRVILLDRASQVRATTTHDELLKLTAELNAQATDAKTRERLGIDATVNLNDDLSQYSIRYGGFSYSTTTQVPSLRTTAIRYGQFADLASQVSIARAVGMPPLGRMRLNRKIAEDGRLAQQTILTINQFGNSKTFRSTHELVETISHHDRKLINEVGNMLALYREVKLRDFP